MQPWSVYMYSVPYCSPHSTVKLTNSVLHGTGTNQDCNPVFDTKQGTDQRCIILYHAVSYTVIVTMIIKKLRVYLYVFKLIVTCYKYKVYIKEQILDFCFHSLLA